MGGYGGTMPVAFFPKSIETKLVSFGFKKSKKGNYYKIYGDGKYNGKFIELLVTALCIQQGDRKGVKWYICTTDSPGEVRQTLDWQTAIKVSLEFNKELEQIHTLFEDINS